MDHSKLFKVLVIGGAMLGMGCVDEAPPAPGDDAGEMMADAATDAAMVSPGEDASMGTDAGATDAGATDAGELMECGFCPTDVCCETDDTGTSTTRAGMMCCWGTSC